MLLEKLQELKQRAKIPFCTGKLLDKRAGNLQTLLELLIFHSRLKQHCIINHAPSAPIRNVCEGHDCMMRSNLTHQ
jgi:hypothetical protein